MSTKRSPARSSRSWKHRFGRRRRAQSTRPRSRLLGRSLGHPLNGPSRRTAHRPLRDRASRRQGRVVWLNAVGRPNIQRRARDRRRWRPSPSSGERHCSELRQRMGRPCALFFLYVEVGQNAVAAAGFCQIHSLIGAKQDFGGIAVARSSGCHTHAHCHLDLACRYLERFRRYLAAKNRSAVSTADGISVSVRATANSSPPRRPSRSVFRAKARRRSATARSTSSPAK